MFDPDRLPVPKIPEISLNCRPKLSSLFLSRLLSVLCVSALSFLFVFLLTTPVYSLSLKLHHQIRLPNLLQRQLHRPRRFPLQLQPHLPIHKSRQPPLKILLILRPARSSKSSPSAREIARTPPRFRSARSIPGELTSRMYPAAPESAPPHPKSRSTAGSPAGNPRG